MFKSQQTNIPSLKSTDKIPFLNTLLTAVSTEEIWLPVTGDAKRSSLSGNLLKELDHYPECFPKCPEHISFPVEDTICQLLRLIFLSKELLDRF